MFHFILNGSGDIVYGKKCNFLESPFILNKKPAQLNFNQAKLLSSTDKMMYKLLSSADKIMYLLIS